MLIISKNFRSSIAAFTQEIIGSDVQNYAYDRAFNELPGLGRGTVAVLKDGGPVKVFLNDVEI